MANTLTCSVQLSAISAGDIGLAFDIRNPGSHAVQLSYVKPFIDFDLAAEAADGHVSIAQPSYDSGVQPVDLTLAAGQTARITTPIQLRFDPNVPPSGGDKSTRWSLRHTPAPLTLRFTLRLSGAEIAPCEVKLDPKQLK